MRDCNTDNGEVFYGTVTRNAAGTYVLDLRQEQAERAQPAEPGRLRPGQGDRLQQGGRAERRRRSASSRRGSRRSRSTPSPAATTGTRPSPSPTTGTRAGSPSPTTPRPTSRRWTPWRPTRRRVPRPCRIDAYLNPATDSLVITGKKLNTVTAIGFFEAGYSGTGPEPVVMTTGLHDRQRHQDHDPPTCRRPSRPPPTTGTCGSRSAPAGRTCTQRNNTLTPSVVVGTPTLTCAQGSSSGNFGTLLLPHSQGPNGQSANIAYNIAVGLEHPLGLFPSPGLALDLHRGHRGRQGVAGRRHQLPGHQDRARPQCGQRRLPRTASRGKPGKLTNVGPMAPAVRRTAPR